MKALSKVAAVGARQRWFWRNRAGFARSAAEEQPRLLVDVSTIIRHDARTGIQRVVRAVWLGLARRSGHGFLVQPVFATSAHGYCLAPADFLEGIRSEWSAEPVMAGPGDKFFGLDLAAHLLPRYRRQLAAWKANGATIHLLVYDLLPLLRPDWFSAANASNFRKWFNFLVNDADQAICISNNVAQALAHRLPHSGRRKPKIARMQMGADIAGSLPSCGVSREAAEVIERLGCRPTILMVGTIEPRKGYDVALAAFEQLWRISPAQAPDLLIVGRPGWKTSSIQSRLHRHPMRGTRLHWLTEVSDEALCGLYAACAGVFVPSRAEGFGLPLVEAAQFRRHVLARDLPVFREQRLPNVSFFHDDAPVALAPRLIELARKRREGPAPAANLATWSGSIDGLLQQLGLPQAQHEETGSLLRQAS